jgi:Spy/CpxP family protein refolding chaperone
MRSKIIHSVFVVTVLTLASASVFASKDSCEDAWGPEYGYRAGATFDKHLAKMHDALKLTTAQEAAWTEFSNKIKPVKMEKAEMDNRKLDKPGPQGWKDLNTPDRLDKVLDNMKSREKRLTEHAAAVRAFYGILTPDQQKIFDRQFQAFHHQNRRHALDMNDAMSNSFTKLNIKFA